MLIIHHTVRHHTGATERFTGRVREGRWDSGQARSGQVPSFWDCGSWLSSWRLDLRLGEIKRD
jgi:hypothetical protein